MDEWVLGIVVALIGSVAGVEYARWRARSDSGPRGEPGQTSAAPTEKSGPAPAAEDASRGPASENPTVNAEPEDGVAPHGGQEPERLRDPTRVTSGDRIGCLLMLFVGGAGGVGSAMLGEGQDGVVAVLLLVPLATFILGYLAYGMWRSLR